MERTQTNRAVIDQCCPSRLKSFVVTCRVVVVVETRRPMTWDEIRPFMKSDPNPESDLTLKSGPKIKVSNLDLREIKVTGSTEYASINAHCINATVMIGQNCASFSNNLVPIFSFYYWF